MILLNRVTMHEIGVFDCNIDIEIGDESSTNDFQMSSDNITEEHAFYIPGTEIGGFVDYTEAATGETTVLRGYTWRGLLDKIIIMPPVDAENPYYTIPSGVDLNVALKNLMSTRMNGFFEVPNRMSGIVTSRQFQFNRYCTVLSGLTALMEEFGARLFIHAEKGDDQKAHVYIEAVSAETVVGSYNEDNGLRIEFISDGLGINHLVCLGSGELEKRKIYHLYVKKDGSIGIGTGKYYTGTRERCAIFDYPSAESDLELVTEGQKRLRETMSRVRLNVYSETKDLEIGDFVIGVYKDMQVKAPISKKIIRITNGITKIEYSVKEI